MATVLLKLPYFKHIFAWMGCLPAGEYHNYMHSWKPTLML